MCRLRQLFTMLALAGMVVGIALWAWHSGSPTARAELAFGNARPAFLEDSGTPPNPSLLMTGRDRLSYPRDGSSASAPALEPAEVPLQMPVEQQAVPGGKVGPEEGAREGSGPEIGQIEPHGGGQDDGGDIDHQPVEGDRVPPLDPAGPWIVGGAPRGRVGETTVVRAQPLVPGFNPRPIVKEKRYPKLTSLLHALVDQHDREEGPLREDPPAGSDRPTGQVSIPVTIHVSREDPTGHLGGLRNFFQRDRITSTRFGPDFVEVTAPVSLLAALASQTGVIRVEPTVRPRTAGVVSEGAAVHGSTGWNFAGLTGEGIKVGILDLGCYGFSARQTEGELPSSVEALCFSGDSDGNGDTAGDAPTHVLTECEQTGRTSPVKHGTAVSETVFDFAPDAEFYISEPQTWLELEEAVQWMISQGVHAINYSVIWEEHGPGDGTSPYTVSPLRTVDDAVEGGVIWSNAGGNQARRTWFRALSSQTQTDGSWVKSDADGEHWVIFDEDTEDLTNSVTVYLSFGSTIKARLWWEDSWTTSGGEIGGANTDMDLFLFAAGDPASPVASSVDHQSGGIGDIPSEAISYTATSSGVYHIMARHTSGDAPDWINLRDWGGGFRSDLEHFTGYGSIGFPANSNNSGLMAVAASRWDHSNIIEFYSSRGPAVDGRVKPEITGVDCGQSMTYEDGFCGTSQASPHVAGIAALIRQKFPHLKPDQVAEYIKDQAVPRLHEEGDPRFDDDCSCGPVADPPNNTWGHGLAQLPPLHSDPLEINEDDPNSSDHAGWSIATNGSIAVVGAPGTGLSTDYAGAAYVIEKSGGAWDLANASKLTPSDGEAGDRFGYSVEVSDDGSAVVVGSPRAHSGGPGTPSGNHAGAAYVFVKPNSGWSDNTEDAKLFASDGEEWDWFGGSVALDGDTVVVGAPNDDYNNSGFVVQDAGSAYVFIIPSDGWEDSAQDAKLTASDGATGDWFGHSVDIDGDAIVAGAPGSDGSSAGTTLGDAGAAYIFKKPLAGWDNGTYDAKLTASDAAADDRFGCSVTLDSGTAVIGAYLDDNTSGSTTLADSGSVYVFENPGTGWVNATQAAKLTASDAAGLDLFGHSVDMDGDTVVVGAYLDNDTSGAATLYDSGSAYVFEKPGTGWANGTQDAKLTSSDALDRDWFGYSVAVHADATNGDTVVVGGPYNDDFGRQSGSGYVFAEPATGWADASGDDNLTPTGLSSGNLAGRSVAVAGDTVVVGAPEGDGNAPWSGAAYVFSADGDSLTLLGKLTASDGMYGDRFGQSVAVDGDTIVVGAYRDHHSSLDSPGSAYVFVKPSAGWSEATEDAKLTASDAAEKDLFGISVAIQGETVVVGSFLDDHNSLTNAGSVYVFVKPNAGWVDATQDAKLTASDAGAFERLGRSVAIDANTLVAGADRDDHNSLTYAGSVYVFVKPTAGWTDGIEDAKVTASDAGSYDRLGVAVDIDGDAIVAGAYLDNFSIGGTVLSDAGSAYVFVRPDTGWASGTETVKLTAPDAANADRFGDGVAIDGNTIVAGAYLDDNDHAGSVYHDTGSVYVFTKPASGWANAEHADTFKVSSLVAQAWLGRAVALSGTRLVAGAPFYGEGEGTAYVTSLLTIPTPSGSNTPPTASGTIADQTVNAGNTVTVSVSGNFSDSDGDTLYYVAHSDDEAVATVSVSGANVVVTGVSGGTATITVTATDGSVPRPEQEFDVTVS